YFALRNDPAWEGVRAEMVGRAQIALDALADRARRMGPYVHRSGWSAADMWLFVATAWFEGLPGRVEANPLVGQILTLGWKLPQGLSRWADAHRGRDYVRSLDRA